MGIFDTVTIDAGYPDCDIGPGEEFQTKCLAPCDCRYRISHDGKLVMRSQAFVWETGHEPPREIAVPFHGDILLRRREEKEPWEFVARFSAGKLQWISDLAHYPRELVPHLGSGR